MMQPNMTNARGTLPSELNTALMTTIFFSPLANGPTSNYSSDFALMITLNAYQIGKANMNK